MLSHLKYLMALFVVMLTNSSFDAGHPVVIQSWATCQTHGMIYFIVQFPYDVSPQEVKRNRFVDYQSRFYVMRNNSYYLFINTA